MGAAHSTEFAPHFEVMKQCKQTIVCRLIILSLYVFNFVRCFDLVSLCHMQSYKGSWSQTNYIIQNFVEQEYDFGMDVNQVASLTGLSQTGQLVQIQYTTNESILVLCSKFMSLYHFVA